MTPPKVTPKQSPAPIFTCEKPEPAEDTGATNPLPEIPDVRLEMPPLGGQVFKPPSAVPNLFDPTRYGLPPDWEESPKPPVDQNGIPTFRPKQTLENYTGSLGLRLLGNAPWIDTVIHFLNQIKRADLDMYYLPVNQGNNLLRFSEYAPKDKPLKPANLIVQKGTTAYVRGEVRPVQGQPDSLITRWVIRYDKPLLHESGLFIRGFSAADAPTIEYDPQFGAWQPVHKISGGDLEYENPLHTRAPIKTPFNSVAPPLPEGHRDWMIAFNPIDSGKFVDSIKVAGGFGQLDALTEIPFLGHFIKGPLDGGRGKLYLWAFNPTVGVTAASLKSYCQELAKKSGGKENLPDRCRTRTNAMPRKGGALFDFFSPLFDSYRSSLLKYYAPYYNPNSEFLGIYVEKGEKLLQLAREKIRPDYSREEAQACADLKGRWEADACLLPLPRSYGEALNINEAREKECTELTSKGLADQCRRPIGRQQIPRDYGEVEKINAERLRFGLRPVGRRRGSIIDWAFTDVRREPARLKGMGKMPLSVAHIQMVPGQLPLRFGNVEAKLDVNEKTDIKVQYYAKAVEVPDLKHPGKKRLEAQIGLKVTIAPLELSKTDFKALGFDLKADSIQAQELEIEIPNLVGMADNQAQTRPPLTFKIRGGEAHGLVLKDQHGDVDIAVDHGTMEEMDLRFDHPPLLFGDEKQKKAERLERMANNQGLDCKAQGNPCHEPTWTALLKGLKGKGLKVGVPQLKGLNVDQFKIPQLTIQQKFQTQEGETAPDLLSVEMPALESTGSMDIDLQAKEVPNAARTSVHLQGESVLKNIFLTSEFKGDHSLLKGRFDLSGTIDRATLFREGLGEVSFTTKTNGHKVKPLSGHIDLEIINRTKLPYQTERPKGPPPTFHLDLDLPYVGFESKGDFTIPPGSATLRTGKVKMDGKEKITGSIEGQLDLNGASYHHKKEKPLELGRMDMLPALKNLHSRGRFKFEILEDGFLLSNPWYSPEDLKKYDPTHPQHPSLNLGFDIDETQLHHCPDFPENTKKLTKGPAFETNFRLNKGQVDVQDLVELELRNLTVEGETKPRLTRMVSGPLAMKNMEGGGNIWVFLPVFKFLDFTFPIVGGPTPETGSSYPDPRALTAHLPPDRREKLRADLAGGDFLYTGGIDFERLENNWFVHAEDVILNLHEQGGLGQYVMLRTPQITFGMLGDKLKPPRLRNHLINALINFPSHGGLTHIGSQWQWRRALKMEKQAE